MIIRWLTAFLDTPRNADPAWIDFWTALTATTPSPRRGARDEFAALLPPDGDAYVWLQTIDGGTARTHLDLHVDDVHEAATEATTLGAQVIDEHGDVIVLRSPAGLIFCVVEHVGGDRARPAPQTWPDGTRSILDQVCLDVPEPEFEAELAWWSRLTRWRAYADTEPEFGRLDRPPAMPLRLLFQRIGSDTARMHLDFAASEREPEVGRHIAHGADLVARRRGWSVLRDPVGREYCITDRHPDTGS